MSEVNRQTGLPAVIDASTRVLIVGSFPSERSLAARQYYANQRNQFWKIIAGLLKIHTEEMGYEERIKLIQAHGIGLWDVVESCERDGSMDSAIEKPLFNDFAEVLRNFSNIGVVGFNGQKAAQWGKALNSPARVVLPSSSPAHAAMLLGTKIEAWRELLGPFMLERGA